MKLRWWNFTPAYKIEKIDMSKNNLLVDATCGRYFEMYMGTWVWLCINSKCPDASRPLTPEMYGGEWPIGKTRTAVINASFV